MREGAQACLGTGRECDNAGMKAVVWHDIAKISLDDVAEPKIRDRYDAIVRLTASAICGTDLHMVRGTMPGMVPGTILGHEGVGIVEEVGKGVRNFRAGDRVVVPSTIGCGSCAYCRAGFYSQCDVANPNGAQAGTAFFGGPKETGPFNGMQAEYVRVPFAHTNLVKLPDAVSDDQALMISDIFTTGYFGADMAHIEPGHTVAVFGCGPVGQFAIASALMMNAGRVLAIDTIPDRLEMARAQGAECIDYQVDDPVATIKELTGQIGVDRAIDAVGVDANRPHHGPAAKESEALASKFEQQVEEVAPKHDGSAHYKPGDAPSQVLLWASKALAKAGTLSIIGVYPMTANAFPIGAAFNRNLTVRMGNCNHRAYEPKLVGLVASGRFDPATVITKREPVMGAIDAYAAFDERDPGWIKVALDPQAAAAAR